MNWQELNAKMQSVEEFPQLDPGDYVIRIREFYWDKVQNFDRLCFRFSVENLGDAIPNKIFFLYPQDPQDEKSWRTTTFKWRRFCNCFGLDPASQNIEPAHFLDRTGRVKIDRDNWNYLNVCHFYAAPPDVSTNFKVIARQAAKSR